MASQPPGPSAPSQVTPASPEKILVFRCITTLLGYIQFAILAKFDAQQPPSKELEVYSAFATVAVINHDVASVSTDVTTKGRLRTDPQASRATIISDDMTASSSGDFGDMESAQPPNFASKSASKSQAERSSQNLNETVSVVVTPGNEPNPFYTPPLTTHPYLRNGIHRLFMVVKNFLRSDQPIPAPTMEPLIKDLERPHGIPSDEQKDLFHYLKKYPANLDKYEHLTLEQHLWVLNQLLFVKSENDTPADKCRRLLRYVVATCYFKLHRRLKHAIWSQPYIDCLSNAAKQNFEFKQCNSARDPNALEKQRSHDRKFLKSYFYNSGKLRDFGGKLNIPNIIRKAETLVESDLDINFDLYDTDTYLEFALLVDYLIKTWQFALEAMKYFRPGPDGKASEARAKISSSKANGYKSFSQALSAAVTAGTALLRLRKGSALPMYLQNIQALLSTPRDADELNELVPIQMLTSNHETSGDQERDQDLEGIHSDRTKEPWERYMDWLKVILAHCDAVWILLDYANGMTSEPFNSISIRVLVAPPVDNQLLSWVTLFENETLFPVATTDWKDGKPSRIVNNADIVSVLHAARKHFTSEFTASARLKYVKLDDIKGLRTALVGLQKCGIDTFSHLAEEALSTFPPENSEDSKDVPAVKDSAKPPARVPVEQRLKMGTALKEFLPWAKFFEFLNNYDEGSRIQLSFKGTLHCEVCIASLLHDNTLDNERFRPIAAELKALGNVIGVSKRCCPVCHYLISKLLSRGEGMERQRFVLPEAHNDVSGCDLPTWLAPGIMKMMIDTFGQVLRKEIVRFISPPDMKAIRRINSTASTGFDQSTSGASEESDHYYTASVSDSA